MYEFITAVADKYLDYISQKIEKTTDEGMKLLYSYVILCQKYHQFYKTMQEGNHVMQELIVSEWMPVFYALNKMNYFEIFMNSIDKEY